jgi:pSer/pThr/pTyr-binding forkhead associated (FHA) protein
VSAVSARELCALAFLPSGIVGTFAHVRPAASGRLRSVAVLLVVTHNDEEIARHTLTSGAFTIGRASTADICLEHRALSRNHARIECRGDNIVIRDLGSQNGTYVNGTKLHKPQVIRAGDTIKIGRFHLTLEPEEQPRSSGRQMVAVITVRAEGAAPASFAILSDEIVFGRTDQVDVTLPSPKISRKHCRLRRAGAFFVLRDEGSQNGTFVNNKRITRPVPMDPGDSFFVDPFTVTIDEQEMDLPHDQVPEEADPDAPMPTAMFLGPAELRDLGSAQGPPTGADDRKAQLAEWQRELRERVLNQNKTSEPPPLPQGNLPPEVDVGPVPEEAWDDATRGIPSAKVIKEDATGRPVVTLTMLSGKVIEAPMERTMITVGDTPDCDLQLAAGDYPAGVGLVLVATEDGTLALIHMGRGQPPVVNGLEADRVLLEPGQTAVMGSFELSWRR